MKIKRIFEILGMVGIAMAILTMGYFFYLQFYPIRVVELKEFSMVDEKVCIDGDLVMNLNFEKFLDFTPEVRWTLVDGELYPLLTTNRTAPVGETSNNVIYKRMPLDVRPGIYHVEVRIDYDVTPIRTISYTWSSNEFEIINCK